MDDSLLEREIQLLGSSSKEVADKLLAEGCKGLQKDLSSCPLAKYLTKQTGCQVHLGIDDVYYYEPGGSHGRVYGKWIRLTKAASDFEADFDSGLYPELILQP